MAKMILGQGDCNDNDTDVVPDGRSEIYYDEKDNKDPVMVTEIKTVWFWPSTIKKI